MLLIQGPCWSHLKQTFLALLLLAITTLPIHAFTFDAQKLARGGYSSSGLIPFPRTGRSVGNSDPEATAELVRNYYAQKQNDDDVTDSMSKMKRQRLVPFPRVGKRQALIPFPRTGKRSSDLPQISMRRNEMLLGDLWRSKLSEIPEKGGTFEISDFVSEPKTLETIDYDSNFPTSALSEYEDRIRRILSN